jgi:hypothetical protein
MEGKLLLIKAFSLDIYEGETLKKEKLELFPAPLP